MVESPAFGKGYKSTAYVPKTDGTKENIRCFSDYSGRVKSQKQMLELTKRYLAIGYE